MTSCSDVEPLLTPYLDGISGPEERSRVEAHLDSCQPCRDHIHAERVARTVVRARAASLCEPASPALRTRCHLAGHTATSRFGHNSSRVLTRWLPLSIAASAVAFAGASMLANLTSRLETSLAAQLTLEHVKCFVLSEPKPPQNQPRQVEAMLSKSYGWDIRVPGSLPREGLELLGARRCLYSEGQMAHLMYRREGRPMSLFVLFDAGQTDKLFEIMGHEAVVWSHGGRTYALVGREPIPDMQRVAAYVRDVSYQAER
jgi:anti-sigma factor RsiW